MHPWIHTRFLPCACMCVCIPLPAPDFWQELLLPLPHKQQALILPSAGFTLFLALLSCLPADMPSLYLVSLAVSPPLPKLVLFIEQILCWSMVSSGEGLQGPNAAGIKTEWCAEACPHPSSDRHSRGTAGHTWKPQNQSKDIPLVSALAYGELYCILRIKTQQQKITNRV